MRSSFFCIAFGCAALTSLTATEVPSTEVSYTEQLVQANAKAHQGQLDSALEQLSTIITTHPEQSRAYKLRGNVYFAMENYRAALTDFDKVIQLAPKQASAYLDRAIVQLALKNYALAMEDTNQVLAMQPDNHEAILLKLTILENHTQQKQGVSRVRVRAKGEKLRN